MNQSQSIRPPQVEKALTLSSLPKAPPQPVPNYFSFTPQNVPKMTCHYHSSDYINYFCKSSQLPLCKQCVPIHQKDMQSRGQPTNIIPLDAALTEVYGGLAEQANELSRMYYKTQELQSLIAQQNVSEKVSLLTNPVQLIESARQQVHSIVDNYFNTLVTFLRARVPESMGRIPDINRLPELKQRWEDLLRLRDSLKTNQCLESLIHYFQGSLTEDNDHALQVAEQELRELELSLRGLPFGIEIPQLHVDPLFLQSFLWALERYAYFYPPEGPGMAPPLYFDDRIEPRVVEVHHHHQEPERKVSRSQRVSELRRLIDFQQQQLNQPLPFVQTPVPQYSPVTQVIAQPYQAPVTQIAPIPTTQFASPIQQHYLPQYQGYLPQPNIRFGQQSPILNTQPPQIQDPYYPSKLT